MNHYEYLEFAVDNQCAHITLNRPEKHNAFDDQCIQELTNAFQQAEQSIEVQVICLAANGKSFSAGADLNWMKRMSTSTPAENYKDSLKLAELMQTIYQCQKPTLAVVQGAAYGGGVGLTACCDIAIANEDALFSLSEVKLGLIPAVISPYVIEAIGARQARRFFITGERFNASKAQAIGLVHEVTSAKEIDVLKTQLIKQLLSNGPRAMQAAKTLIDSVKYQAIAEELSYQNAETIAEIRATPEAQEGLAAFFDKRKPNWIGS